jgi:hypothetical protein
MAASDNDVSFLSRWSRRKAQARLAPEVVEPAPLAVSPPAPEPQDPPNEQPTPVAQVVPMPGQPATSEGPTDQAPPEPVLTLADVARLTRESDFAPFMAGGVQAEVRNAALRKLFSDPHFNLMDGLDVYIDDYGVPDPLPQSMLLKMAQAKFLGLLGDKTEEGIERLAGALNEDPREVGPAPADAAPADLIASNEDPDLQLQSNDAIGRAGTTPGAGQDTGREH